MNGATTSLADTQVTSIQRTGFWVLIDEKEFFIDFEDYPDFKNATVAQIHSFRRSKGGLHWENLDVDIEIEALRHPEKYPLAFMR
ncbi:MAG: DUF2442 domain-containing protein [Chloroflexi bacterium]|nr:DUF2442 domain-containing protein [Chloroflexota bacterium]